jgi:hypothetical protein
MTQTQNILSSKKSTHMFSSKKQETLSIYEIWRSNSERLALKSAACAQHLASRNSSPYPPDPPDPPDPADLALGPLLATPLHSRRGQGWRELNKLPQNTDSTLSQVDLDISFFWNQEFMKVLTSYGTWGKNATGNRNYTRKPSQCPSGLPRKLGSGVQKIVHEFKKHCP